MRRYFSKGKIYKPLLETLDRAGFDSDAWAKACDELAWLLRSRGTILAPYSPSEQTLDVPISPSMHDVLESFHSQGWIKRDPRAKAFPMLMRGMVVTDRDLFETREMERLDFYADWLSGLDLKWFAAAGFAVDDSFWAVSVHKGMHDEPFSADDLAILRDVMEPFQLAAPRTKALGLTRTDNLDGLLSTAGRGVAILGWNGRVIRLSEMAETLLERHDLLRQGRLRSQDPKIQRHLDLLVARGLAHGQDGSVPLPAPLVLRPESGTGIAIDLVPMPRDFGSLLTGAAALLTVHDVKMPAAQPDHRLRYGLTNREAQLATKLASGQPIVRIAEEMGISTETARQYLKSIFAKTGTNRQAELVALLSSAREDG